MPTCPDDGKQFSSEAGLRTHQGKVHGTVLGSDPTRKKGPRRMRCTCLCGFVHRPLHQILGYRKVPMLDRFTGDVFLDPETGAPIEIFDASRSIEPLAYGLRSFALSGSFTKVVGDRIVEVGTFQKDFPPIERPGVRCICMHCNHMHIRKQSK